MITNLEARTRNVAGTHEVRSTMRHQTHAYRVKFGLAIFITFSPSERDSTLMVRMARARPTDPAAVADSRKAFYSREKPQLDVEFCRLSPERLAEELPNYQDRRALLARDPLARHYGFQVLVGLALRHIFGLRFCPQCPNCSCSDEPCADAFGSNATARGGVFGRMDAVYGSLECQKSGAFHLHGQFFLQCVHQFTPLCELVRLGKKPMLELLRKYSDYSAHVRRMVYCDKAGWDEKQKEVEDEWPEYKQSTLMLNRPRYQIEQEMPALMWKQTYLAEDVELLQMHKQHHVHIVDG
ncbi:ATP-dependent DNA helicase, partial [Durusdinium trenchii]